MCAQGGKCQKTHRCKERRTQERAPGYWPDRECRSHAVTAPLRRESCCTLETRGCRQDRQSSQQDTSWWDSTSTTLRKRNLLPARRGLTPTYRSWMPLAGSRKAPSGSTCGSNTGSCSHPRAHRTSAASGLECRADPTALQNLRTRPTDT